MNGNWLMKNRADERTADGIFAAFENGDPRQFDVRLANGMRHDVNTDEDEARAKQLVEVVANIGVIEPQHRLLRFGCAQLAAKPLRPNRPSRGAPTPYLAEVRNDSRNHARTVADKKSTVATARRGGRKASHAQSERLRARPTAEDAGRQSARRSQALAQPNERRHYLALANHEAMARGAEAAT